MKFFVFKALYQNNHWLSPAYVGINEAGIIDYLSENPPQNSGNQELVNGIAVPSFVNSHSHAFQYAMAGLAERHSSHLSDNFWTWREAMYHLALTINPEQMEAIAAMLYAEMLRVGYTQVVEFHYVHQDLNGKPYQNPAELSERLIAAAQQVGIKITLIPIYYQKGGFGLPPNAGQKRFICQNLDEFARLREKVETLIKNQNNVFGGNGFHSLRAIELADIEAIRQLFPRGEILHLHLAEQKKEVKDCLQYTQNRPLEWLMNHLEIDEKFHLVHCTHLTTAETTALAKSGAKVVLCPSTEGNLGDGFFNLKLFQKSGGNWSIGTDSHIGLNPLEELRWLDYAQRLKTHQRNSFIAKNQADSGKYALEQAINTGRQAAGLYDRQDFFEIGKPLDALILDSQYPLFACTTLDNFISTWVYTSDPSANLGALVNGKWIIKHQAINQKERLVKNFQKAIGELANR
ncbi:MAG: formimidoylglutamate deiminase [Microscillaceae bacterium]|jgi:formimidoylglutamate deiminase|nr:formimidoylglutamate deiminase [Microscillaceae bacterium]